MSLIYRTYTNSPICPISICSSIPGKPDIWVSDQTLMNLNIHQNFNHEESSSSGQFFQLSFHNLKLFQSNLFWIDPNRELRKIFENQILKNETGGMDFNWSTGRFHIKSRTPRTNFVQMSYSLRPLRPDKILIKDWKSVKGRKYALLWNNQWWMPRKCMSMECSNEPMQFWNIFNGISPSSSQAGFFWFSFFQQNDS